MAEAAAGRLRPKTRIPMADRDSRNLEVYWVFRSAIGFFQWQVNGGNGSDHPDLPSLEAPKEKDDGTRLRAPFRQWSFSMADALTEAVILFPRPPRAEWRNEK